jgi:Trk-type K+ transport system membrane component
MMYIAVYPIAIAIRSTNVYEEQSMGIFEDDTSSEKEAQFENQTRSPLSYIAYHGESEDHD